MSQRLVVQNLSDRNLLNSVQIASPCHVSWDSMSGDEKIRFCQQCSLKVHNLSAMTTREAAEFLQNRSGGGHTCIRLFRRADGTILTADCPHGLRLAGERLVKLYRNLVATICWLSMWATQAQADGPMPQRRVSIRALDVSPVVPKIPIIGTSKSVRSGVMLVEYAPLMKDVDARIKSKWVPSEDFDWSKKIVVRFKLQREGNVTEVNLMHSCGDDQNDALALNAVTLAAPFRKLPDGAGGDVEIEYTFDEKLDAEFKKHVRPGNENERGHTIH